MGIISTGCAVCRKRRIKCDEAKPGCMRCFKIGKSCPGYDRGLKLVFYSEGSESRSKSQTKKSRKNAVTAAVAAEEILSGEGEQQKIKTQTSGSSESSAAVFNLQTHGLCTTSISSSLSSDLEARSVSLFVTSFVRNSRPQDGCSAFLDFLPELYARSAPSSPLHRSLAAVAQLNFLNRYKASNVLSGLAKRSYVDALNAVNLALSDPSLAVADQTLASVWLLSMYELIVPGDLSIGQRTPWVNHVNGTIQLLRMRGGGQVTTDIGRQLFRLVHLPIIVMNMIMGEEPCEEVSALNQNSLVNDPEGSQGSFLVSQYIQQVARVRSGLRAWAETCGLKGIGPSSIVHVQQIIRKALSLKHEGSFENWADDQDERRAKQVSSEEIFRFTESKALSTYFYASTFAVLQWVTVWTTKLLLLQSLIKTLTFLGSLHEISTCSAASSDLPSTSPDIHVLKSDLSEIADKILGSVAFTFGDITTDGKETHSKSSQYSAYNSSAIGAYHLFWPVAAIVACPYTTPKQKLLAKNVLVSVGERFCIVQALQYTRF